MNQESLALACVLAPLAGFAVALIGFRTRHKAAAALVVLSGLVSVVAASILLLTGAEPATHQFTAHWFTIGDVPIEFGLLLDGKTLIMGAVVAIITFLVQVYSLSYMNHDPRKGTFFAFLAFFEWSMLSFVYSASLLQTFIFWELVGLASFLLIGFWYEKPSAVAAAKKAFLMTRIGDVGFFIGMILLFRATGTLHMTDVIAVFAPAGGPATIAPGRVELIATLLFIGVMGKSAQFPLHTWLPDAMEGPTPVSALLHSATMVAAGVFLVARLHDLFLDAPHTMRFMLTIATFTALLASTMAIVAKDIKRVLAYSTISQLGFMLIGLSAGSLFAGFFHLTAHAFFKALLFLCSGAYIHHFGTNDMIALGRAGAAKKMPITTFGLIVGGLALAGIPPLSAFFSKEQILHALDAPELQLFLFAVYAAAFLTAYYTFRMVFLMICPNPDSAAVADEPVFSQHADATHEGAEDHGRVHEPWAMLGPILVLSLFAIFTGFLGERIARALGIEEIHHAALLEMVPAVVIVLLGVLGAWLDFGRRRARQTGVVARFAPAQKLFENRWYLDVIYNAVFVRAAVAIARLCYTTETRGLDGAADGVADGTAEAGAVVARSHSGRLQLYIGTAVALVAILVIYIGTR